MTFRAQPTDLLIAPPGIPDERFAKTVLMLTHHHDQGSSALCVNREINYTLQDLIARMDQPLDCELNFPLYWGGPVSPSTIWMLHSAEWSLDDHTVNIDQDWSMTSNLRMFELIAQQDFPRYFRIMCGYCAWGQDQLTRELEGQAPWKREHSWLVARNLGPEWLFEQPVEDLWSNATTVSAHQAVDSWL